jgi:hypothetical protein
LILSLAVEWSLVGDGVEYSLVGTIATGGPSQDANVVATDGLIKQRKADYRRARDAAERDGKAVYRSDGLIGQPLPKGLYELIRHKGEVWFIEVAPAGVPVPKPDPAAMFRGEDCLT